MSWKNGWKWALRAIPAVGLLSLFFTNCQEYRIADEVSLGEIEYQEKVLQDERILGRVLRYDEFIAAYHADRATRSSGVVSGLSNLVDVDTDLFPGLIGDFAVRSPGRAPALANHETSGRQILAHRTDGTGAEILTTAAADNFFSDRFSIIAMVRKPVLGDVITLVHDPASAAARKISSLQIIVGADAVTAFHFTTATRSASVSVPLPAQDDLIIAASFGIAPDEIALMVNGVISQGSPTLTAAPNAPEDAAYLHRYLQIGSLTSGSKIQWGEAQVFLRRLTGLEMSVLSRDMARRWQVANVFDDPSLRAEEGGDSQVNPLFAPALAKIVNNCGSCHFGGGMAFPFQGMSATTFKSLSYIVPGNAVASKLIHCASAPSNRAALCPPMPSAPAIDGDFVSVVSAWINSESP